MDQRDEIYRTGGNIEMRQRTQKKRVMGLESKHPGCASKMVKVLATSNLMI